MMLVVLAFLQVHVGLQGDVARKHSDFYRVSKGCYL